MLGMMQIVIYMLAFYFILKGVEILQIGLASSRADRKMLIGIGAQAIAARVVAAYSFVAWGDRQAQVSSSSSPYNP